MTAATAPGPVLKPCSAVQFGDYVADLAWRPDGELLAVACADGAVHEMLPEGGASAPVHEHPGGACAVAFSSDGTLASAGSDGRVAIGVLPPLLAGAGWIELLAWSPDGGLLASAVGRRVQLWRSTGELVAESPQLAATVECFAWSSDCSRLACGGHGGVTFLDRTAQITAERFEFMGVVLALAWSPDGLRLACGMQDCAVWVWDVLTSTATTLGGYPRKVRELAWNRDGDWLVTGGGSQPLAWRFPTMGTIQATEQVELRGHKRPIVWAGFQSPGPLLATAGEDGVVILWLVPGFRPLTGATIDEPAGACAWSPDGQRIALGGESGRVAVFALEA